MKSIIYFGQSHFTSRLIDRNFDVWYFDSGASKHITSQRDMFTSLEVVPIGNYVTCVDNSSYPIKGVGQIVLVVANDNTFTLRDDLYVLG